MFHKNPASDIAQKHIDFIRLSRSENVGAVTFGKLIKLFKTPKNAIDAISDNACVMGRKITLCTSDNAVREYESGIKIGAKCVTSDDTFYPAPLHLSHDAPPFFWAIGNIDIFEKIGCAIVGARGASVGGRKIAYSLASALSKDDFVTVSGMARGIDAAAHQGGITATIAVLAGGVNVIYPPEHTDLYQQIIDNQGCIISESPPFLEAKSNLFPRRNRIISGLSAATVIIEAGLKSGSLTTAEFALGQNREIFAVPGSPLDMRASGTNKLLRQGASWAENSHDVLSYLQGVRDNGLLETLHIQKIKADLPRDIAITLDKSVFKQKSNPVLTPALGDMTDDITDYMPVHTHNKTDNKSASKNSFLSHFSTVPVSADMLVRLTGKPASDIAVLLAQHELMGDIERQSGNMFIIIPKRV